MAIKNKSKKDKSLSRTNVHTLKLYWEQIKKNKTSFFVCLTFIPISALLMNTLLPYFFSQAIGDLVTKNQSLVNSNLIWASLVGLGGAALNYVGFQSLTFQEANTRYNLYNSSFAKILNKDVRFFSNEKVGALTSRFIDFIRSHSAIQDLLIIRTLGFVLSVGVGMSIVATRSIFLALVILVLIICLLLQVKWSMKKRQYWRNIKKISPARLTVLLPTHSATT